MSQTQIRGVDLVNSTADAPGLSDTSAAVVTSAWVKSLLTNTIASGSATLPGGFIIKWGETGVFDTGPTNITFASSFPSNCFQVVMTDSYDDGNVAGRIWLVASISRSGFQCRNNGTGSGKWLAIGN